MPITAALPLAPPPAWLHAFGTALHLPLLHTHFGLYTTFYPMPHAALVWLPRGCTLLCTGFSFLPPLFISPLLPLTHSLLHLLLPGMHTTFLPFCMVAFTCCILVPAFLRLVYAEQGTRCDELSDGDRQDGHTTTYPTWRLFPDMTRLANIPTRRRSSLTTNKRRIAQRRRARAKKHRALAVSGLGLQRPHRGAVFLKHTNTGPHLYLGGARYTWAWANFCAAYRPHSFRALSYARYG